MVDTPQTTAGADPKEARVLNQHLDPAYAYTAEFDPETPGIEDGLISPSSSVRQAESSLQLQGVGATPLTSMPKLTEFKG